MVIFSLSPLLIARDFLYRRGIVNRFPWITVDRSVSSASSICTVTRSRSPLSMPRAFRCWGGIAMRPPSCMLVENVSVFT